MAMSKEVVKTGRSSELAPSCAKRRGDELVDGAGTDEDNGGMAGTGTRPARKYILARSK